MLEMLAVPGPRKYTEFQPFGLLLGVQGYYFAYFCGLGSSYSQSYDFWGLGCRAQDWRSGALG